jgi:hypothetical protein
MMELQGLWTSHPVSSTTFALNINPRRSSGARQPTEALDDVSCAPEDPPTVTSSTACQGLFTEEDMPRNSDRSAVPRLGCLHCPSCQLTDVQPAISHLPVMSFVAIQYARIKAF